MFFNLFEMLWSAVIVNVYTIRHTHRKPPPKLLRNLAILTCSSPCTGLTKYHAGAESSHRTNADDSKGTDNSEQKQHEKVKENDSVNNINEWRFITRALDKIIFILSFTILTFFLIFICLINYVS